MNADLYTRMLFGENAVHVPMNLVVQQQSDGIVLVVGTMKGATALAFGGTQTHQLLLGDAIVRPRLVLESNHLRGMGLSGIVTGGMADWDEWRQHGRVLLGPHGGI
jgi:hypothetical protein